jgi:hypothetical protein
MELHLEQDIRREIIPMKKIVWILSMVFIFLVSYNQNTSFADPRGSGKIAAVEPLEHEWGQINIEGGLVSHTFTLSNLASDDLILMGAFTSCKCTTAVLEFSDGRRSPQFSIRNNPGNWVRLVKPGESFVVYVEFDPNYHGPKGLGSFRRSIHLVSSAPVDGKTSFSLNKSTASGTRLMVSGIVLSEEEYKQKQREKYATRIGDFDFAEKEYDFGVVKQSQGIVSHKFPFRYNGQTPIKVASLPTSCPCAKASIDTQELQPGDEGVITVEFDPNFHEEPEGKFFKTVFLLTEPKLEKEVELKIWVEINLDLGPEAYKQKGHKY